MPGIFISYRREDSEGYVGRLYEDLVGRFGNDAVFMDVATIKAGRDFRRVIDEQVSACGVLLVVMGRNWLEARNESGQRRLDLPTDAVRLEVAAALRRDIPVIPVLVQGARMPAPEKLPADLSDLAYRNAVELTHPRWTSDVELLIEALEGDLGSSPVTKPVPSPETRRDAPAVAPAEAAQPALTHADAPPPAVSNVPSAAVVAVRSRWRLAAGVLAALAVIGGSGIYFWHDHNLAIKAAEQAALEEAAKRAAAEKAEADRIAALKAKQEEEANAEAARLAAEKAAADAAALEKTRQEAAAALEKARKEAAAARAEAERLAADLRREKAATEAASAQSAAAQAEARQREAAAEARAREAAAAEERARQAAEKQRAESQRRPPTAPPAAPLTAWLGLRDFFNLRQRQPKGQDFPYAFQAGCVPNESFRVRGRFGAYPDGVSRFSYAVLSPERYQEANSARTSQGYKLYSRQSVSCPVPGGESKTIWVAAVWVQ